MGQIANRPFFFAESLFVFASNDDDDMFVFRAM